MQVHHCSQNTFVYHPHQPNLTAEVIIFNAPYAACCIALSREMIVGFTHQILESLAVGNYKRKSKSMITASYVMFGLALPCEHCKPFKLACRSQSWNILYTNFNSKLNQFL